MLRAIIKTSYISSICLRNFSKLEKLSTSLLTKHEVIKKDWVDKDPEKDFLKMSLQRREKENLELKNNFNCVSLEERLQKYQTDKDGKIISCFLKEDGTKRTFKNLDIYKKFCENKMARHLNRLKHRLTPMQLYVTQDCGTEKPFTGSFFSARTMGTYSCVVCNQRIFMYVCEK